MPKLSLFEKVMFEAPGDPPPDLAPDIPTEADAPPDMPAEGSEEGNNETPPDMTDNSSSDETPPDMTDTGGNEGMEPPDLDEGLDEDPGDEDGNTDQPEDEGQDQAQNLNFDEKISAIMNMNLYQRFLSLLNNIGTQLSLIKNNSDMLYTLSPDSLDIIESLKKLDENVRLYLTHYFLNENYSKNLLFFNKCLNLLKLLNNVFEKNIQKGIKSMD